MLFTVRPHRLRRWLGLLGTAAMLLSSPALMAPTALHAQALPNLGGSDSAELSPLMERKLGEEIMNSIRRDPNYLGDLPTLERFELTGPEAQALRARLQQADLIAEAETGDG